MGYVVAYLHAEFGSAKVDEFDRAFSAVGPITGVKVTLSLGFLASGQPEINFSSPLENEIDLQEWDIETHVIERR